MDRLVDCLHVYPGWLSGGWCLLHVLRCVLRALHTPQAIKPNYAPLVVPGPSQDPMLPFSLSLPLTKHTACPSHVPVGHHAPVIPLSVYTCVFYALTLPCLPNRGQRWSAPSSLLPYLASPHAPLCSCVRWCVSVSLACHVM